MRVSILFVAAFMLPSIGAAQAPPPPLPPPPPVEEALAPPGEAPRPAGATSSVPPIPDTEPFPEKIESPLPPDAAPTVNIRRLDSGDVVEEYRLNGRLYEVRVRPQAGVPYTLLDINGDGRLDRRDTDGPVAPVYYTLYEWN
jgi:hypothetical protein